LLTNHASCVRPRPRVGLRDIATTPDITERSAYGIVTDLTASGYVVKARNGWRNRYQIQAHLPLRVAITQQRTIGEVFDVLVESDIRT
jgi:DNA-binding IclR family transcriptional regulator